MARVNAGAWLSTTALWILFLAPPSLSEDRYPEVKSDSDCDCYRTNGSVANTFTTHKFFDFRSLGQYAGVPDVIRDPDDTSQALATSDYFLSDEWNDHWVLQHWNNSELMRDDTGINDATYLLVNSPNNVYIEASRVEQDDGTTEEDGSTYLTMRTVRVGPFQSAAEFESVADGLHYVSVRMRARTRGAPGAVSAMFTYRAPPADSDGLSGVQESDLEIRTSDPSWRAQYTNQPSYTLEGQDVPEATRNATLPRGLRWSDWADYRMDWTPARTAHFVDGDEVASIAFQNPRDPCQVFFNCWSDGGSWSGVMRKGHEAFLQIQWIEMLFNETDTNLADAGQKAAVARSDEAGCKRVCSIDDTETVGTAVLIDDGDDAEGGAVQTFGSLGYWHPTFWITVSTTIITALGMM